MKSLDDLRTELSSPRTVDIIDYSMQRIADSMENLGRVTLEVSENAIVPLMAAVSTWHAEDVAAYPWYRLWWHVVTGHRYDYR